MNILAVTSNLRRTMLLIAGCFVLLLLGVAAVALVSRSYSSRGIGQTQTLTGTFLPGLVTLARLQEAALQLNSITLQFALAKDDAAMNTQKEAFATASSQVAARVAELQATAHDEQSQQLIAAFSTAVQTYSQATEKFQATLRSGDFEKAMAMLDHDVATGRQGVEARLRALSENYFKLSQGAGTATADLIGQSARFGATAAIVQTSLVLVVATGALLGAYQITRRLNAASQSLADSTQVVQQKALLLSTSSTSLADGSSQQAAALEETSASLEELNSMTKRNAENAQQAKQSAGQARGSADTGTAQMGSMHSAMQAIQNSSNEISKIIKTIDEIAFQTNILALNAAVEAARAGEAGAGFAVVADEVRALAQRCAAAAKETATKIEDSVAKSQQGVQISGEVAKSFETIQQQIRQLDQLVAEIATASHEQSQGLTQVTTAVSEMDRITQFNAANAEETAAATEELKSESTAMFENVGMLRQLVGGHQAAGSAQVEAAVPSHASLPPAAAGWVPRSGPSKAPARRTKPLPSP